MSDPSAINTDGYGRGWLFTFATDAELIEPPQYVELLEQGWEETQRTIKGQIN